MQVNPMFYPDMALLLTQIQRRLDSMENKIDILVARVQSMKSAEAKPLPVAVQQPVQAPAQDSVQTPAQAPAQASAQTPAQSPRKNAGRQEHRRRERLKFKAICADCQKECELPFKPSGDRPVYCHECYGRRKAGNSQKTGADANPAAVVPDPINPVADKEVIVSEKPVENDKPVIVKKPVEKKRPIAKKKPVQEQNKKKAR